MSTVRLVSVVVPDWLMATTNVSCMLVSASASLSSKPLSSEALRARNWMDGSAR